MLGIIVAIHIIACVGLIFFILIQTGKGGGLIESFSSAESIFGTKTSSFLTKATSGLAITFFITCLVLAFFSVQQSKSIVTKQAAKQIKQTTKTTQQPAQQTQAKPEEVKPEETKEPAEQQAEKTVETNAANQPAATNQ